MRLRIIAGCLAFSVVVATGCSSVSTDADVRHEADKAVQTTSDQLNNLANLADEHIGFVKNGTMNNRDDVTLGEVMDAFFDGPTWQYFSGTNDETGDTFDVVEFTGYFLYNEKSAKARIQFILHEDDTFEMGVGSYNDIDQTALVLSLLMDKVYESYDEEHAVSTADQAQAGGEPVTADSSQIQAAKAEGIGLENFYKWTPGENDRSFPLMLDGEEIEFVVGRNTPNGIKMQVFSSSMEQGWQLPTELADGSIGPFNDYGDLIEGFSLYVKEYDFASDGVPEVVLVASDGMLESYVWVYNYNYTFSEYDVSPLELVWYGEGQSDVQLEGDRIVLPYGSQGLYEEYVYKNEKFIQ
ncbi:hypothetical protein [Saccharibacillus brassicae]|uniref:Uncharacterized protein n=1 Tax=Saccharibacillus brassicae TaxID=2583377 RepID=A0A4Y6UZN7_SACBS|nr:hypothetical protein [Saccharibacillus brassicae]QDH21998.1 hypothetical protein FFV09_14800 [Saccharibacillus brassicae]